MSQTAEEDKLALSKKDSPRTQIIGWSCVFAFAAVAASLSWYFGNASFHQQMSEESARQYARETAPSPTPAPPGYDLLDRGGTITADTHLRVIVPGGLALGASVLPGTRAHCIAINERQGAKVQLLSGPEKGDEGYIDLADFRPDPTP